MWLPAFLPTILFEIGNGAVIPVVALSALHLGASAGQAAFMLALLGIGRLLGDLPASWLAHRVGDHRAMLAASALALVAFAACLVARSLPVLGGDVCGKEHSAHAPGAQPWHIGLPVFLAAQKFIGEIVVRVDHRYFAMQSASMFEQ